MVGVARSWRFPEVAGGAGGTRVALSEPRHPPPCCRG